jgi:hypothetical protein
LAILLVLLFVVLEVRKRAALRKHAMNVPPLSISIVLR